MTPHRRKLIIENRIGLFGLDWSSLWEYRELLYFLVWKDLKVRYKQTAIGVSWVLLQPLITMLIFTAVFGHLANVPSDGVWYPIFTFTALLPWTYFAQAMTRSSGSLVSDANMVRKIYFPRVLLPLATIVAPLVDLALSLVVLFALLVFTGIPITFRVLALPGFILLAMLIATGLGLFISATNVRYRDVGYTVPFLVQVWMFVCPIVYPVSLVPEQWQVIYGLNPMVGVIEGFRWALLGKTAPNSSMMVASYGVALVLLLAGTLYFNKKERHFADFI